ncbi:MAG: hypothetical protein RBR43_09850 [Desulfuromonadaceae bacterium]|nr:hypothetical protein [Desulfuromonadaceae bacterium]
MTVTASDLRETLKQAMDLVISGSLEVDRANAVANLATKMIDSAKAEVLAAKVYDDLADINAPKSTFVIEHKSEPKP